MSRRNKKPTFVTQKEREAIVAMLRAGKSVGQTARESGRAKSTVGRIAREEGISVERTATEKATRAKQADNAARRAELARLLLEDAFRLRQQLWKPVLVYNFGGRDNTYAEHILPEPDARTKREILTAIGIAVDKVLALEKHDTDPQGLSEIDRWLEEMTGGAVDGTKT